MKKELVAALNIYCGEHTCEESWGRNQCNLSGLCSITSAFIEPLNELQQRDLREKLASEGYCPF